MTASHKAIRVTVLAAQCVVFAVTNGQGQQAPQQICEGQHFAAPRLCEWAQLDSLSARYIIVLDESASMARHWTSVTTALDSFIGALPDRTFLHLIRFSGRASSEIEGDSLDASTRRRLREQARGLSSPTGTSTDIGEAINAVLRAAEAAPNNSILFVVFLTDGEHAPAATSLYRRGDAAWEALRARATAISRGRPISVRALTVAPDVRTDLLRSVFPSVQVTNAPTPAAMRTWLHRISVSTTVNMLTAYLASRLPRPDTVTVTARLASNKEVAPRVEFDTGSTLRLFRPDTNPVRLRVIALRVRERAPDNLYFSINGPVAPLWLPPATNSHDIDTTIWIQGSARYQNEFDNLGMSLDSLPVHLKLRLKHGGPLSPVVYWSVAGMFAILAVGLGIRVKWALHKPKLSGKIIRRPKDKDGRPEDGPPIDLRDKDKESWDLPNFTGKAVLRFVAFKRRGQTKIRVEPIPGVDVKIKDRKVEVPRELDRRTDFDFEDMSVTYSPDSTK